MELISIIMPVYNSEKFLRNTINSIIKQTYKNWELIIIDDGSTDSSANICKEYVKSDQRIKLFCKKNEGVSVARNYGINNAAGKYIMFIDSDDMYNPKMIEKMYNKLISEDVDIVKANYEIKNSEGLIIQNKENIKEKKYEYKEISTDFLDLLLTEKQRCYIWLLLIRKCLVKQFSEKLFIFEDMNFYIDVFLSAKSIYVMEEKLYIYNKENEHSLTKKNIEKNITNMIVANNVLKDTLKKYQMLTKDNISKLDTRIAIDIINYVYIFQISNGIKKTIKLLNSILEQKAFKKISKNFNDKFASKKEKVFTDAAINKKYIRLFLMIKLKNIKNRIHS